jgi:hypothetical protein
MWILPIIISILGDEPAPNTANFTVAYADAIERFATLDQCEARRSRLTGDAAYFATRDDLERWGQPADARATAFAGECTDKTNRSAPIS